MIAYLWLAGAILFEVLGTTSMTLSRGFTRPWWTVSVVVSYAASLGLLTMTLKTIPVGLAYALWSGVGTMALALVGWLVFRETLTLGQVFSVVLIIVGVAGLNLLGKVH